MILFNGVAYRKYLDSFAFLMRRMTQQNWTADIGERLRVYIRRVLCDLKVLSLYFGFPMWQLLYCNYKVALKFET